MNIFNCNTLPADFSDGSYRFNATNGVKYHFFDRFFMADNKQTHAAPEGQLLLRIVAMPRDTNPNQDIFGGWIMSQMDLGGGIFGGRNVQGRIVTVAVQEMNFIRPVKVGNVVGYGHCVRVGNTFATENRSVGEDFDERYGNGRPPTGY